MTSIACCDRVPLMLADSEKKPSLYGSLVFTTSLNADMYHAPLHLNIRVSSSWRRTQSLLPTLPLLVVVMMTMLPLLLLYLATMRGHCSGILQASVSI